MNKTTKSRGLLRNGAKVPKLFIKPQQPLCKQRLWQKLIKSALFF